MARILPGGQRYWLLWPAASVVVILLSHWALSLGATGATAEPVVRVIDGDTVDFAKGRCRLVGIDAPEMHQPYGIEAREALIGLLIKQVTVERQGRDRYGRYLCTLRYENGKSINVAIVLQGGAWAYRAYLARIPWILRSDILAAEADAQDHKRGLWAGAHPIPPWQWRRGQR